MSGPQCCSHPPTLNTSSGSGHVEKFGGLDTYLVGSPDSKMAVLFVSDVFGYEAPNLRKLADKLAAAGIFIAVPDFFYGDPFELGEDGFAALPGWIKHHAPDKAFEDAKPVLEANTYLTVKVPTQILGAEIDGTSPPELVKQFEEALAAKSEITSQVKIFPKVEHGWTTRYNVEDEAACKAAEEAYEDLMAWFLNLLYCEEAFSDISE